jgi:hypothetical protein
LRPTVFTVLDRDTLARSEERELNGVFRGLVILQTPGSRGSLSGLFVRGASAGLGQLSFDGADARRSHFLKSSGTIVVQSTTAKSRFVARASRV